MSTDPQAKLFYGYIKLAEEDDEDEDEEETPWDEAHTKKAHGCTVDLYGYGESLGYILAVEESLHTAEWDEVKPIDFLDMGMKSLEKPWDEQLRQAAEHFGLDVTGLVAGWYLVCLYL